MRSGELLAGQALPNVLGNGVEAREGSYEHRQLGDQAVGAEGEMVDSLDLPISDTSFEEERGSSTGIEHIAVSEVLEHPHHSRKHLHHSFTALERPVADG